MQRTWESLKAGSAILGRGSRTGTYALSFDLSASHLTAIPKGVGTYNLRKVPLNWIRPRDNFHLGPIGSDLDGFTQRAPWAPCLPFASTQHKSATWLLFDPYIFLMFSIFFFFGPLNRRSSFHRCKNALRYFGKHVPLPLPTLTLNRLSPSVDAIPTYLCPSSLDCPRMTTWHSHSQWDVGGSPRGLCLFPNVKGNVC